MLIVEGTDNTGKTTLIHKLLEEFPQLKLVEKRSGPGTREGLMDYANEYLTKSRKDTHELVFDRFTIPSEYVYGKAIRGEIALTYEDRDDLEFKLHWHHPLVIFCNRPLDRIKESFSEREQMEGVLENLQMVHSLYVEVMEELGFEWFIQYNYEREGDYEEVVAIVKDYLEMEGGLHD